MPDSGSQTTVAVVSFNTRELLLRCLRSLADPAEAGEAVVWVIDNGSSDGSAQAAREFAPWVNVLTPARNLGFGPAVNEVARRSTGGWLMCANADIALEPGTLRAMLAAGRDAEVACVAPRLLLPDGRTQHSVHPFPTVTLALTFNLGLHRLNHALADRLCLEGYWDPERPRAVPWAIGACLLLRRHALEQVGGFDERQWVYAEDLDLGWRLAQRGWITRYEPAARVQHESGASTAPVFGADLEPRFMAASYATLERRRGRARMLLTAAINIAGAGARVALATPLARISPSWRRYDEEHRRWLRAHLRGLRFRSTLARPS
jgi:N-acetylglucosaminyl-diphospho-decaprenol L-rhamnosyltransferase